MAVIRKAHTKYKIWWDTSTLSFPIYEAKVCKFIHKDDVELAKKLKVSCTVFDQKYPEGQPANIFAAAQAAKHHKRRSGWKRKKRGQEFIQSSTSSNVRDGAVIHTSGFRAESYFGATINQLDGGQSLRKKKKLVIPQA
jgi:hypothetical protein